MARTVGLVSLFLACLSVRLGAGRLFSACGSPSCLCFPDRAIAACSTLGPPLTRVPHFQRREVSKITGVNLSRQDIQRLRPTDFTRSTWPALEWVDLRANRELDCSSLRMVPKGVKVLSDCPKPQSPQLTTVPPTQNRAVDIVLSDSSDSVGASTDSKPKAVDKNRTKTKQVVIPFKGYFKLFLPEL